MKSLSPHNLAEEDGGERRKIRRRRRRFGMFGIGLGVLVGVGFIFFFFEGRVGFISNREIHNGLRWVHN